MPIQGARTLAEQRQASRALLLLTRPGAVSGQSAHDVSKFYRALLVDKTLLTPSSVNGPQRATFASELKIFLSSSGLPSYLLAAFAKRLMRTALTATPSGAAIAIAIVYNMLLQHPTARALVHRPPDWRPPAAALKGEGEDGGEGDERAERAAADDGSSHAALLAAAAAADPFRADEADPEQCGAIDSCLWEVDTLRQHACPTVASLASLFATPMAVNTPPVDLEPLGTLSYAVLGQLETRKRLRTAPLAVEPPGGLFARPEHKTDADGKYVQLSAGLDAWRA